ncbi:MAG: hypothetical protein IJI22_01415 [Bacilli bacterium]|nr:hypothetical protein [Bacilli bacterium]
MKKIDKHIYFTPEEFARISEYQERNKMSYSSAVCSLSISALNSDDVLDRLSKLESSLNYIIKKLKYISLLDEQIYSDMDFDNLTDPKNSKALNEFHKKIRNNYIDD